MIQQVLTVICKLGVEEGLTQEIDATLQGFADCCNWINSTVDPKATGRLGIHIDQRISFLMQSRQQSPNQITQVLAQSPAVQELLRRSLTYVQSYSEFCQSYARDNQATWQASLDQYHRAVEMEHQQQEQRRRALELRQQQQLTATHRQTPDGSLEKELHQVSRTQKRSRSNLPQITDSQLVAAELQVALYFQTASTNPTDQQLAQALERHQNKLTTAATAFQEYRRSEQELASASIVDKLLPSYREKKEAAKLAARFIGAASEMERTQEKLNQLEQQRRTFEQWQTSPQTQEMECLRDYLSTPEAQTRRHDIKAQLLREKAQEIEQKRLSQQRQPQQKPERNQGRELSL